MSQGQTLFLQISAFFFQSDQSNEESSKQSTDY